VLAAVTGVFAVLGIAGVGYIGWRLLNSGSGEPGDAVASNESAFTDDKRLPANATRREPFSPAQPRPNGDSAASRESPALADVGSPFRDLPKLSDDQYLLELPPFITRAIVHHKLGNVYAESPQDCTLKLVGAETVVPPGQLLEIDGGDDSNGIQTWKVLRRGRDARDRRVYAVARPRVCLQMDGGDSVAKGNGASRLLAGT
jgi:hypothetical protein